MNNQEFIKLLKERNVEFSVVGNKIGLTSLPDGLSVDSIYLGGCTGLKNVTKKEDCGECNRTIYALKNKEKIMIAAGCFLGDCEKFCKAVDKKYTGEAAEKYKADAKEIIEKLEGLKC